MADEPIARTVTDAAIALSVLTGPDPLDARTSDAAAHAQQSYTGYLKADILKNKRFGVPTFILNGVGIPFHGVPAAVPEYLAVKQAADQANELHPKTRAVFLNAFEHSECR